MNSFVVGDPLGISDHCTIEVILKSESDYLQLLEKSQILKQDIMLQSEGQLEEITPIFKWNENKKDLLLDVLNSEVWRCEELSCIRNKKSVSRRITCLQNLLIDTAVRVGAIVKYFPNKKRINPNLRLNQPWFDQDCIDLKKKWKMTVKLWRDSSDSFHFTQMTTAKREFKNICKRKKLLHSLRFQDHLQHLKREDSKSFWKVIQGATKAEKIKGISKNIEMKDWLNHFRRLHNSVEVEDSQPDINMENIDGLPLDYTVSDITMDEIQFFLNKVKTGKAPGLDGVVPELIKTMSIKTIELVAEIFNDILNRGEFPEVWTTGIINPVFKTGNADDVTNYRGITLLPVLSKLFTAILPERIKDLG